MCNQQRLRLALSKEKQPEVFHSQQGEGPFTGRPSIFIRLSECNLYCAWCDTPYTWNWRNTPHLHDQPRKYDQRQEQTRLNPEQLLTLVRGLPCDPPCRALVLTGGEPLLQQKPLLEFLQALRETGEDWSVDVETNGTVEPRPEFDEHIAHYVVSPKLANAGIPGSARLRRKPLAWFAASDKSYFKFVVSRPEDAREVLSVIETYGLPKAKTSLMPAAATPRQLQARSDKVRSWAAQSGLQFSDRLHLRLYGARRGT